MVAFAIDQKLFYVKIMKFVIIIVYDVRVGGTGGGGMNESINNQSINQYSLSLLKMGFDSNISINNSAWTFFPGDQISKNLIGPKIQVYDIVVWQGHSVPIAL